MSKVAIKGNASGTGTFTVEAPNSNTDRTLVLPDEAGTVLTSASTNNFPAGSVLQVVSFTKTNTASFADGAYRDTGLSVSITPSATSSKIMIIYDAQMSAVTGQYQLSTQIVRGSTPVGIADEANNRVTTTSVSTRVNDSNTYQSSSGFFLDSPNSTSALTYKIWSFLQTGGGTYYINRTVTDNDNVSSPRAASTITLMEVAG